MPTPLNYPTMGLIGVTLLGLIVVGYKKRIISFQRAFKEIVHDGQKDQFLYKRKVIIHFEENEKKILPFLLANNNQFVSLNKLNGLFENPAHPKRLRLLLNVENKPLMGYSVKSLN